MRKKFDFQQFSFELLFYLFSSDKNNYSNYVFSSLEKLTNPREQCGILTKYQYDEL